MSDITITRVWDNRPAGSLGEEIRNALESIRNRAFNLFERRGAAPGRDLEDWLQAERELFWVPPAELAETDRDFRIRIATLGLDVKDLNVTALNNAIFVRGSAETKVESEAKGIRFSEFGSKSLFRRFELPSEIDVDKIAANLDKGMLTIIAPKKAKVDAITAAAA
jgi:HSP20 family protein